MKFLQELESNLDESIKKLEELNSLLEATDETVQSAISALKESTVSQATANESVHSSVADFLQALSETSTSAEHHIADVTTALDNIVTASESDEAVLDASLLLANDLIDTTRDLFGSQQEAFSAFIAETIESISNLAGQVATFSEGITQETSSFSTGISDFLLKSTESNEKLSSLSDSLSSRFSSLVDETLETLTQSGESIFSSTLTTLTEKQTSSIEEPLVDLSGQLADYLEDFSNSSSEVGEQLKESLSNIIESSATDISNNTQKKLEEAFEQAIENFLQALLEELAVAAVTMTTGASLSSVMAPLIPALKGVGTALEALNDGLDLIG